MPHQDWEKKTARETISGRPKQPTFRKGGHPALIHNQPEIADDLPFGTNNALNFKFELQISRKLQIPTLNAARPPSKVWEFEV
ncbi:MAG: hypothetical protein C5B50_13310 [Verrucomicrobia bacterium]|nr:MAG: hypothetical protein C5B50_13310 [Verrucomicrobiota bacterium]